MNKQETSGSNMAYAVLHSIIGGLGLLPHSLSVRAGRALGRLIYMTGGGLRRAGERNLELAFPELSERERTRLLRGCFNNSGRHLAEIGQLAHATRESLNEIIEFDPVWLAHFEAAKAEGRGIIFLTCHIGAWEVGAVGWSALKYPLSFLALRFDHERMDTLIEGIRTRFGNRSINRKNSLRRAFRVLREGGILCILADINMERSEGIFVPFFHHLACTTPGVAWLALRADAVVLPTCVVLDEERKRYCFRGDAPVELLRTGDETHDIETNTARFNLAIEKMVRAYPDQYLWMHRRWRTRPPGEPDLYGDADAPAQIAR